MVPVQLCFVKFSEKEEERLREQCLCLPLFHRYRMQLSWTMIILCCCLSSPLLDVAVRITGARSGHLRFPSCQGQKALQCGVEQQMCMRLVHSGPFTFQYPLLSKSKGIYLDSIFFSTSKMFWACTPGFFFFVQTWDGLRCLEKNKLLSCMVW